MSAFDKGNKVTEYFTGTVFMAELLQKSNELVDTPIVNVTFEAGSRTNWHTHGDYQVLLVTDGEGWYQMEGQEKFLIKAGDVITIPGNIKHWHGATDMSAMTHIAINKGAAEWLEPVSEADYLG